MRRLSAILLILALGVSAGYAWRGHQACSTARYAAGLNDVPAHSQMESEAAWDVVTWIC
jgi:hypothetical protein